MPWRWWSGCTARCQIIPPRPGRSSHTVPGSSSHSTSMRPTISPSDSAINSIDGRS